MGVFVHCGCGSEGKCFPCIIPIGAHHVDGFSFDMNVAGPRTFFPMKKVGNFGNSSCTMRGKFAPICDLILIQLAIQDCSVYKRNHHLFVWIIALLKKFLPISFLWWIFHQRKWFTTNYPNSVPLSSWTALFWKARELPLEECERRKINRKTCSLLRLQS